MPGQLEILARFDGHIHCGITGSEVPNGQTTILRRVQACGSHAVSLQGRQARGPSRADRVPVQTAAYQGAQAGGLQSFCKSTSWKTTLSRVRSVAKRLRCRCAFFERFETATLAGLPPTLLFVPGDLRLLSTPMLTVWRSAWKPRVDLAQGHG